MMWFIFMLVILIPIIFWLIFGLDFLYFSVLYTYILENTNWFLNQFVFKDTLNWLVMSEKKTSELIKLVETNINLADLKNSNKISFFNYFLIVLNFVLFFGFSGSLLIIKNFRDNQLTLFNTIQYQWTETNKLINDHHFAFSNLIQKHITTKKEFFLKLEQQVKEFQSIINSHIEKINDIEQSIKTVADCLKINFDDLLETLNEKTVNLLNYENIVQDLSSLCNTLCNFIDISDLSVTQIDLKIFCTLIEKIEDYNKTLKTINSDLNDLNTVLTESYNQNLNIFRSGLEVHDLKKLNQLSLDTIKDVVHKELGGKE